ncbi:MAG: hypothetical protein M3Z50_00235 [Actinomycetota bacterium]|nr:hypothetical protein [Actinomycetota bacterium]
MRALGVFVAVRVLVLATFLAASGLAGRDPHRILTAWDSQWYAGIAADGYGHTVRHLDGRLLSDYAFFPLLPLGERVVAALTGLAYVDAGFVVSVLASLVAAAGIHRVGVLVRGERAGLLLVLLWAAMPVGTVEWLPYSESLFTALAAWALWGVLTRRWWLAGSLAALAGATRPIGAAVVLAVVIVALVDLAREHRRPGERLLSIGLAPLGMLGYLGYVGGRRHRLDGYFAVTSGWHNQLDGGASFARWVGARLVGPMPVLGVLLVLAVGVLLVLTIACFRQRQPLVMLVYTTSMVALALATSGYFGSKPRYLLPAFPLLLPVAGWLARRRTPVQVGAVLLATVGAAAYGAVWLLGPGPP